jgi:hypothetical protein
MLTINVQTPAPIDASIPIDNAAVAICLMQRGIVLLLDHRGRHVGPLLSEPARDREGFPRRGRVCSTLAAMVAT